MDPLAFSHPENGLGFPHLERVVAPGRVTMVKDPRLCLELWYSPDLVLGDSLGTLLMTYSTRELSMETYGFCVQGSWETGRTKASKVLHLPPQKKAMQLSVMFLTILYVGPAKLVSYAWALLGRHSVNTLNQAR